MSATPSHGALLREIRQLLGPALDATALRPNAAHDLFEAYVWSAVLEAARDLIGANKIWLEGPDERATRRVVLRTSPGMIWSTLKPYTYAVLDFGPGQELEAHVGVRVMGKSSVLHECDVAVIDRAEGTRCRAGGVPPRSSSMLLATEAKFYTVPLDLSLAREFVGLRSDLSANAVWFVANTTRPNLARFLVRRTQANTLHANVSPSTLPHDDLVAHIRLVFHDYLAR